MGKATQNARLRALIQSVENAIGADSDKEQLLAAVQQVRDFKEPLQFDNATPKTFGLGSLAIIAAAIAFGQWAPFEAKAWLTRFFAMDYGEALSLVGLVALVVMIASFVFMRVRSNRLRKVSEEIAGYSSWLTLDLRGISTPRDVLLQRLSSDFGDYARGNYSREITYAVQSVHPGAVHELPYAYYQLHYVDKRIVTTTESDGKGGTRTVTRTVYDHYDRYSLVIDFPWVEGVTARTTGGRNLDFEHRHETASSEFNKAFTLSGGSRMACARFAKPVTVLHLLNMHKQLHEMNLEFSWNGQLCMSFENSTLLKFDMHCDLSTPDEFHAWIDEGVRLPRLENALALVHTLAEQHDDNFNLPSTAAHQKEH
ncbi:hypothetical protein [Pseudomonas japonica]|uniref:Uncharacterized protein n=1 Tax=Pseudomonas japonica TaxID=256466 RepID=A0A239BVW5_9PSED|nr:hypothetical protein [Pseudomonas japonica]SNS11578.1 hypothetical protein SAMN05444352_103206 [Pseudomonas japonica]